MQNEWLGFDFDVGEWVAPYGKGKVTDIRFRFRNELKGWKDHVKLDEEIEYGKKVAAARKQEWSHNQFMEKFKITAGKWDAQLEISFPGEKEGMHEVAGEIFLPYSQLKMPHEAPAEGYVPSWRYTVNTYLPPTTRENAGFFLRTRVKLNEQGNIVSAHYTKVMGDFQLATAGRITFTYYFNPTPNDRNLEFDPKRNLFPKDMPGANVFNP